MSAPLPVTLTTVAPSLPVYLRHLATLVVMRFGSDGQVQEMNRGAQRIFRGHSGAGTLPDLGEYLVNPPLAEILALPAQGDPPRVFAGLITLGLPTGLGLSLRAEIFREGSTLLLLGEHDLDELERLGRTLLEVNEELAQTQRELARRNRDLQRAQAELSAQARSDALTGVGNRRLLE
ncbi:MAG: GGDEF domain-containing protein, partial [Burkholderiales bacterium]